MTDFTGAIVLLALIVLMVLVSFYGLVCALVGFEREARRIWKLHKENQQ